MNQNRTKSKPPIVKEPREEGLDETACCAFSFGDYAIIEQKRYGVKNEMYIHKVIGTLRSNSYVDVPVQSPARETLHSEIVDVVACVCCGVSEREILRYRTIDISLHNATMQATTSAPRDTENHKQTAR